MKNSATRFTISLLLLAVAHFAQAQFWVLKGTVLDSADKVPMMAATVVISNPIDSTYKAKVTDQLGQFRITGIQDGRYELKISFVGFLDFKKTIVINGATQDLGEILMRADIKQLEGVTVEGLVERVTQKGDTTIMNAEAYKVNPDANAQDLLEKMPGIVVVNGQVQAQGEAVRKVLVDGREFFGNDPNAALQNLPAEIIAKIQVYDEASDQAQFTGFADGETSKVLNIITKASMSNGEFGKIYAGAGTDDTYNVGGSINLFRPKSRTTILAQTNNINIQNFSTSDLLGVTSGAGRGGRGGGAAAGRGAAGGGRGGAGGGGDAGDFLVGQQGGISKTTALGINYSFQPENKKIEIQASYFFNESNNNSDQSIFRQFTLAQNDGQTYEENNLVPSTNTNHRFSAKIDYKINDKNSLTIRPQLTLQQNNGASFLDGITMLGSDILNTTNTENSSNLSAYTFSNNLLFRHSFEQRGRTLSFNLNTSLNGNDGESFLFSQNEFFNRQGAESQLIMQRSQLDQTGVSLRANATFTEPISDKSQLLLTYQYGYQFNDSNKETFDFNEGADDYSDLNIPLSNIFENDYITHQTAVGYNLRGAKANLTLRAAYQWASLHNDQTFPTSDNVTRSFNNFLPNINYRFRISQNENIIITYRANTQAPSVSQLQNVIDNSNPLFITAGNPDLEQNYQHNATFRYTKTNTEKSTTFFALLNSTFSNNYIGNSTTIASRDNSTVNGVQLAPGSQFSQPVNLDGYINLRGFMSYGIPLGAVKSNLNLTFSANYNRTPEQINDLLNYSSSPTFGLGAVFGSNISEKIDFTLSSNSSFSSVNNTVQTQNNTEFFTQSTRLRLNWIFGPSFVIRSEMNHTANPGLSDGFNNSFLVWNMEFGKKLMKEKAELKLTVFDLLKENQSVSRSINGSYIQDTNTQILTQYFMLTFTYNIRNFGSGNLPNLQNDRLQRFQQMRQGAVNGRGTGID
ncbi:MAG: TonB-dependent receptor [Cytophagales bacterium CG12_big_fil_rev_8_21_14_0_65_40_12]|nr:MAG: TonB-dependent receptor [Cytophagales bacterium CG12_big_fil_rev_8_21_14_0_65_40_12]PIW04987.1 MAG: TonB-dependent receptor [Cytophagales bacterium CG17_big_fil_post_rev_8_21_14_2_50_40_13]